MRLIMTALLVAASVAVAQEAGQPAPAVDPVEVRLQELKLQTDQLNQDMFRVLRQIRLQREEALTQDKELKALQDEIRRLQDALEKRLQEKYPAVAALVLQRDDLQEEYDQVRGEQVELRNKQLKALKQNDPSGKE